MVWTFCFPENQRSNIYGGPWRRTNSHLAYAKPSLSKPRCARYFFCGAISQPSSMLAAAAGQVVACPANSVTSSHQELTVESASTGGRRICQWYCCDCGKSYGTLRTPTQEPAVRPTDKVVVEPATRFTCLRCRHMMCPYCLKVRYQDLMESVEKG